jgi:catechol 2,3-dioxygenase-like lactoylglutathione lyase family enzyme
MSIGAAVPIVRIFDEAIARKFYVDYLGFTVQWEHRFEPGLPLYMRVARDACVLDLSEHHGDGTPGTVLWIPVTDVRELHDQVHSRRHLFSLRPGIDPDGPGGPTMEVPDPFGNSLRFAQP